MGVPRLLLNCRTSSIPAADSYFSCLLKWRVRRLSVSVFGLNWKKKKYGKNGLCWGSSSLMFFSSVWPPTKCSAALLSFGDWILPKQGSENWLQWLPAVLSGYSLLLLEVSWKAVGVKEQLGVIIDAFWNFWSISYPANNFDGCELKVETIEWNKSFVASASGQH